MRDSFLDLHVLRIVEENQTMPYTYIYILQKMNFLFILKSLEARILMLFNSRAFLLVVMYMSTEFIHLSLLAG
jgi:hypothetical protein